jgi:galactose oxidase
MRISMSLVSKLGALTAALGVCLCLCLCQLLPNTAAAGTADIANTDIVSASSGQCATVNAYSTTEGTPIVQWPCGGVAEQRWSLVAVGNNYHIVSVGSGLCLNINNGSATAGAAIIQWPCQGSTSTNDQWQLVSVGEYTEIVSAYDGQCINVDGNSQAESATLIQWPCAAYAPNAYNDLWSLATPAETVLPSIWTPVISLPVTPIAIANLPNGNILMWSAFAPQSYEGDIGDAAGQTYTGVFNPTTQTSTDVLVTNTGADMFCPGTAVLPDGSVLVNGGSSSAKTSIYNPATSTWSISGEMNIPRGYEADTLLSYGTLANGALGNVQVLTLGGSWSGAEGGKSGEIWNSNTGTWTELSGVPETNVVGPDPQGIYRGDNHLWMFAQSNGAVFQAGPSAQMNWITTAGSGTIQSAGNRGTDPYSINGNAVLYDVGKILKVGGAPAYQQSTGTTYATNSAYLIDITAGVNETPTVTQLTPMSYQRAFSNSVVLPDGTVVVIGGQSIPQPFTDSAAILVPEIWSPVTQKFSLLNPMQTPRTYHSTALLLPDGRVFVGGGGQCGTGCAQNHLNAEILTPPYLLTATGTAATRPVITAAATQATLGGQITASTSSAVASFVLMRLSATTHTVNNDQRRIPLTIATATAGSKGAESYTLKMPSADPGVVLPGYYMLFALNSSGVPSVSTTIQIL